MDSNGGTANCSPNDIDSSVGIANNSPSYANAFKASTRLQHANNASCDLASETLTSNADVFTNCRKKDRNGIDRNVSNPVSV
jgi:hypothetical protein